MPVDLSPIPDMLRSLPGELTGLLRGISSIIRYLYQGQPVIITLASSPAEPDACTHDALSLLPELRKVASLIPGASPQHHVAPEAWRAIGIVRIITFPLADGSGRTLGYIHVLSDSSRDEAREVMEYSELLMVHVGVLLERSDWLRCLVQARNTHHLSLMTRGIVHDFNNYLNVIVNAAHAVLEHAPEDALIQKDASVIVRTSMSAAELLRMLSEFARDTAIRSSIFSLNDVVRNVISMLHYAVHPAIAIRSSLEDHLPLLEGSSSRIRQVVFNVGMNAAEAIGKSSGSIHFTTRTHNGLVMLDITDSGPGIPEQILPKIFSPFVTTKPEGASGGLGLSIVSAIVRQHGGAVAVSNLPEGGACFTIQLPGILAS